MKKIFWMLIVFMTIFTAGRMHVVIAEDEAVAVNDDAGVAGCAAVAVDPDASLEFQQGVCNAAEGVSGSSCAASGHGTCSSPKMNDTMPDANHCICISEDAEDTAAEEAPE